MLMYIYTLCLLDVMDLGVGMGLQRTSMVFVDGIKVEYKIHHVIIIIIHHHHTLFLWMIRFIYFSFYLQDKKPWHLFEYACFPYPKKTIIYVLKLEEYVQKLKGYAHSIIDG